MRRKGREKGKRKKGGGRKRRSFTLFKPFEGEGKNLRKRGEE